MLNPLFELFRGACYSGNMRRAFSEKKRIRALYANETNYVHVVAIRGKVTRGEKEASVTTRFSPRNKTLVANE